MKLDRIGGSYCATIFLLFIIMFEKVMPSSEKRLIKQLIDNYEKAGKIGRPVKNKNETVVLGFGLSLFQLLDLDEKSQVLTVNVWAKYTWVDHLLRWDPSNYSNIREVRIPPKFVWTPDIVLYNFVDERLRELRDVMLNVDYTGRIFWNPPAIFKSSCHIDIRDFPFDYQYCFLKFVSRNYNNDEVDLQFFDNRTEIDMDEYTKSAEWIIHAHPAHRLVMMSERCGQKIPDLTFFLFLQRNPVYYGCLLVFPCILLSLLTTVVFWLPPHSPAKTILSMNIFVAYSTLLNLLASSTPSATPIVPYLGYYYCFNMTLLSISVFLSTTTINLHSYGKDHVPKCLVSMVCTFALALHITDAQELDEPEESLSLIENKLRKKKYKKELAELGKMEAARMAAVAVASSVPLIDYRMMSSSKMNLNAKFLYRGPNNQQFFANESYDPNISDPAPKPDGFVLNQAYEAATQWSQHSTPDRVQSPTSDSEKEVSPSKKPYINTNDYPALPMATTGSRKKAGRLLANMLQLKEILKNTMGKLDKKDAKLRKQRDWHLVSMTLDRLFFYSYLLIIIFAGCLLIFPRGPTMGTMEEYVEKHKSIYNERNKKIAAACFMSGVEFD
ncbi:unnamed protein product [Calicophoron daubneyi]|uniref:Uncharacterized protein n=1 Tax=Calicophoron daubneyi TaxID=300641 RepID=A0AAV2TYR9_CALDB